MAIIRLDGTLQLTKSGSRSVVTLWETKLNQQTQQDQKTAYKLWLDVPLDWTEGSWVEIEGELSVRPSMNQDGTPRTYLNKNGHTITAHDLNVNNVTVIKSKIKQAPGADSVDLDDVAKYGQPNDPNWDTNPF